MSRIAVQPVQARARLDLTSDVRWIVDFAGRTDVGGPLKSRADQRQHRHQIISTLSAARENWS
jgi:hypothetical protein